MEGLLTAASSISILIKDYVNQIISVSVSLQTQFLSIFHKSDVLSFPTIAEFEAIFGKGGAKTSEASLIFGGSAGHRVDLSENLPRVRSKGIRADVLLPLDQAASCADPADPPPAREDFAPP